MRSALAWGAAARAALRVAAPNDVLRHHRALPRIFCHARAGLDHRLAGEGATSSFAFKGRNEDIQKIGELLRVSYLDALRNDPRFQKLLAKFMGEAQ